MFFLVTV